MARLDKTLQEYQEQLKVKGIQDVPEFVQSILDADITKGKYARYLLDCFINNKFQKEDLKGGLESTVGQAIILFHKHKAKLPNDMRSVYKYESPGDLWNVVRQFDDMLSDKSIKNEDKDKIYAETEFLYENPETDLKIISPLTEESAKWWGRGTRWGTSAKKNNIFYEYAKDAPLLIFLMPGGKKLQLWKHNNHIQFMDRDDSYLKLNYIEKNWGVLEPVCLWLKDLRYIPEEYRSYNLCLEAVKQNKETLHLVPEELRDYTMCLEAVKKDGSALRNVPEELRDYALCLEAVKNNGDALECVPEKLIDYTMCLEAVKQNGNALQFVPKKIKDYDLYLEAVKSNEYVLRNIPEEHKDYNMCLNGVKNYGLALYSVSETLKDYNLCLEAVKNNGSALYSVSETLKDYNLCLEAIKKNGDALEFVPEKHRDYNLCLESVKQNGYALESVPEELRDYNLCLEAVKQNGYALECVPEEYQEKLQNYFDERRSDISKDKYQQTFNEIRSMFPEKELSLTI